MEMTEAIKFFDECSKWAVLGVTTDRSKFGYKIYKRIKSLGKTVYGISNKYAELEGDRLYNSILDVPEKVDVVVFVVNPHIGINELDNIKKLGIENIWLQPGTTSPEFMGKVNELNFNVSDKCVLVVSDIYKR